MTSDEPEAPVAPTRRTPADGQKVIAGYQRTLPDAPGVYRMFDRRGMALYVGKAKSLKKRVMAYVSLKGLDTRLLRMVAATVTMEFTTTHTEVEALLLESNLIKSLKPRYNILLRDDKSFPYILITADQQWPMITKHRGSRKGKGRYFGPYASAGAVNDTLAALQRAFPLRVCSDSVFASRTRPCLQFQIKRCTAPCVGRIDHDGYLAIVNEAIEFLSGKSHDIQTDLSAKMEAASAALDFEQAAMHRDRLRALAQVQSRQGINFPDLEDTDVIAAYSQAGETCVQVFFFRHGRHHGNRPYYPAHTQESTVAEVLAAFVGQFYATATPPPTVLLSHAILGTELIEEALTMRAGRRVHIEVPVRGTKRGLVEQAETNARGALDRRLSESASQRKLLDGVAKVFGLEAPPARIEVYDNSHTGGTNAVGTLIVAGPEGFMRNQYRTFNIKDTQAAPGDDFAMMREVFTRRFSRLLKEHPEREPGIWPDLVLIDGGAGQLSSAQQVFADLGLTGVALAGIAKGPDRNAGKERFFLPGREPFVLPQGDPVLYFLERLRDEAHRFAISTHRGRRSRKMGLSPLDEIPGIGPTRKRALLHRFGSAKAVGQAALSDLESVDGVSSELAETIFRHFHAEG